MTNRAAQFKRATLELLPSKQDYRDLPRTWRQDLVAGITVGIVALPLALAFGVSSGAGAESGLITAIIAGIVAAIFGGSHVQVSGPTGAMVVVLAPLLAQHGLGVLALVCVMAGIIVIAAGVLRLGQTVSYIPWPVIEGFTLGIAVIIFLQQVPSALGVEPGPSDNAAISAFQALQTVDGTSWVALLVVGVVIAIMVVSPRIHQAIPGSIVAIIVVTVVVTLANVQIPTIGALPDSLPAPRLPTADLQTVLSLVGPAFTIAALAAIESLLSVRVAASTSDTGPYHADRELVGQGLASVASGFFGGMPATGAIARTAVNIRAGGRTRMSALVHAGVLIVVVYLASTAVSSIPLAALAGVLMVTAMRMISITTVRTILGSTKPDAIIFTITAVITVSVDLIYAVAIGIAVAAFFALRSLARSAGVHREQLPGTSLPGDEQIAVFRLEGALFFGAAERIMDTVGDVANVKVVILRLSQLQILDATGAQVITELIGQLERRGITVLLKGIRPRHLPLASRVGVLSALRHENHLFDTMEDAIEHARTHTGVQS